MSAFQRKSKSVSGQLRTYSSLSPTTVNSWQVRVHFGWGRGGGGRCAVAQILRLKPNTDSKLVKTQTLESLHLCKPSIVLSHLHFVPWNLNPGLQGTAVTLNVYLFLSVEKMSSNWKWCTDLFFTSLYTVLLASWYANGKDCLVTGDNRCMMLFSWSLGSASEIPVSYKVAMVKMVWFSSS